MCSINISNGAASSYANNNLFRRSALVLQKTINSISQVINEVIKKSFEGLKLIVHFPTRFKGSKLTLGKAYEVADAPHQELTKDRAKQFLRFSAVTATVFNGHLHWITPLGLKLCPLENLNLDLKSIPGNLYIDDNTLFDESTGLKVMVVESEKRKDEIIVTFGACGAKGFKSGKSLKHNLSIVANLFGFKSNLYTQADAVFKYLKSHPELKSKKFILTGHSLAGGIANYVGLMNENETISFNAVPVGAGLQENIGFEKLKNAHLYLTQVSNPTDFCSDLKGAGFLDKLFDVLKIRTPGTFGKRLWYPASQDCSNVLMVHGNIMGSLMSHIGYPFKYKVSYLSPEDLEICS